MGIQDFQDIIIIVLQSLTGDEVSTGCKAVVHCHVLAIVIDVVIHNYSFLSLSIHLQPKYHINGKVIKVSPLVPKKCDWAIISPAIASMPKTILISQKFKIGSRAGIRTLLNSKTAECDS